jgi:hypothetical protein
MAHYLKPSLLERDYADFSSPSEYDASFCRLLKGIRKKSENLLRRAKLSIFRPILCRSLEFSKEA